MTAQYVDKHLIGRHEQEDHDPTKKKRDHSREDHKNVKRVRARNRNNLDFGYEETPANSAAILGLGLALLGYANSGGRIPVGLASGVGGALTGYQLAGGQIFGNPEGSTAGGIAAGVGNTAVDPLGTAVRRALYGDPNEQKLSKRVEDKMSTRISFLVEKAKENASSEEELHDNLLDITNYIEKMLVEDTGVEDVSKQTVTVEEYTRADGTVVPRHERKISARAAAALTGALGVAALASPLGRSLRQGARAGFQSGGDMASWRNIYTPRQAPGTRMGLELGSAASRIGGAATRGMSDVANSTRSSARSGFNFGQFYGPVRGSGSRITDVASQVGAGSQRARTSSRNARLGFDMGRRSGEVFSGGQRATRIGSQLGSSPARMAAGSRSAASSARSAPSDFRAGLGRAQGGNPSGAYRAGSGVRSQSDSLGARGRGAVEQGRQGVNAARINFQAGRSVGAQGDVGFRGAALSGQASPSLGAGVAAGAAGNTARQVGGRATPYVQAFGQGARDIVRRPTQFADRFGTDTPGLSAAYGGGGGAAAGGLYGAAVGTGAELYRRNRERTQKSLSDADIYVLEKYLGRNLDG